MTKDTQFPKKKTLHYRGILHEINRPWVMGIVNLTPDSFHDGGKYGSIKDVLVRVEQILKEGAAIIDLGALSTRPGAMEVSEEEEKRRLLPALDEIIREFPEALLSVDTFRPEIARHALEAGAGIINDIYAGINDPSMMEMLAKHNATYIMMHMQGTPSTMHINPEYKDVLKEVLYFLSERVLSARKAGICDIIIDPGFGFGKTVAHNFRLLSSLQAFSFLECPVLVGISRKSMINKVLEISSTEALNGTTVLNTIALMKGADILRVHDVKEAVEAVKLCGHLHTAEFSFKNF